MIMTGEEEFREKAVTQKVLYLEACLDDGINETPAFHTRHQFSLYCAVILNICLLCS